MKSNTAKDPVVGDMMSTGINNARSQALEGLESTLEKPDGMLRADSDLGDLVVEVGVVAYLAVRLFVWCYHPDLYLDKATISSKEGR